MNYQQMQQDKMLQVTITGQLVLLMLIEMLEDAGISVISGNTDGIVSKYHKDRHNDVRAISPDWRASAEEAERIFNKAGIECLFMFEGE